MAGQKSAGQEEAVRVGSDYDQETGILTVYFADGVTMSYYAVPASDGGYEIVNYDNR